MQYRIIDSPVGPLSLVASERGLGQIHFGTIEPEDDWKPGELPEVVQQLEEYFRGERTAFDLPLDPVGTPFQLRVWEQLRTIPYGQTVSYGDIARGIGSPNACRAVGAANGRNPISIVVPCHRVIGSDGSLTGFGGGLDRKRALLRLEASGKQISLF